MSYQKVNLQHAVMPEYEMASPAHDKRLPDLPPERSRSSSELPPALFWHMLVLIIPMTAMAVVLLVLVSHYRVYDQSGSGSLALADAGADPSAIYLRFSATQLVFIASFASTLAAVLSGSILYFLSYPAGQRMLQASGSDQPWRLPTPCITS